MPKLRWRKIVKATVVSLLLLGLLCWIAFVEILPRLAASFIKDKVEALGWGEVHVLPPDIGLYRTTLANFSIGDPLHPHIAVASATITYLPTEAVYGRFKTLVLNGLLLRIDRKATAAATSTAPSKPGVDFTASIPTTMPASAPASAPAISVEPPLQSATITNGRIELVDAITGLPSSVLVDAQAKAAANRTIDFSVDLGFGAIMTTVRGTSDSTFQKIDAAVVTRGITLDALQPFVPSLPAKFGEPAEIDARVHYDRTGATKIDLTSLNVRVPKTTVAMGQKSMAIDDLRIHVAASLHQYGSDWYGALTQGPDISVQSIAPPEPFHPLPVTITSLPTYIRINADGWGISGGGMAIDIDKNRFGLNIQPFTFASTPQGPSGSATVALRTVEIGHNPVFEKIVPEILDWNLSGQLDAGATLQLEKGQPKPSVRVRLANCSLNNKSYELKVQGVNVNLSLSSFSPLRTDADQTIEAKYVQMGKWEIVDANARFAIPGTRGMVIRPDGIPAEGDLLKVELAKFGWAGGEVWCTPFDVNLASPRIRTQLGAKDLDLSKVMWVASNQKAWAEGIVDLELWADFSWPELRFGKGWATSRPDWRLSVSDPTRGKDVVLHLPDSAQQMDNWFRMRDPRFQDDSMLGDVRKQVVEAVGNFYVNDFRADFSRDTDGKQITTISLHGGGREKESDGKFVDTHKLTLNLSITDMDILISHFLKVKQ